MLPFEIPPGTTLAKLITDVVPAAHARLVPPSAGREPFTCAYELEGAGADAAYGRWIVAVDGPKMTVRAGEEKAPDARIRARFEDAQVFLDDYLGPKRLAPQVQRSHEPGGVVMLSDPRAIKRVRMVTGVFEIAIRDFDDGAGGPRRRVAAQIALGAPAKKVEPDADVVVEVSMDAFLRLAHGGAGPEEALADGDVTVKGKRLLAMQLAFAIGPLFPPPRK